MNAARIGVLVLALVAAGLAAFLARGLVSSGDSGKQVEPKVVEAPTSEILVAADNIETGGRLSASNMKWQKWPDSAMNPIFITKEKRAQAMQALDGAIARLPIVKGEPIVPDRLVWTQGKGLMSALLKPGMRAVAIRISPETSAGGFILPNDHVDVLLTGRSKGSNSAATAETIMRDVRILAIDQRFNEKEGGQVAMGKTATLELTPTQAELITMAEAEGKLTLALRSIGDKEIAGADQEADNADGSVVRVVRFGQTQSVRVK